MHHSIPSWTFREANDCERNWLRKTYIAHDFHVKCDKFNVLEAFHVLHLVSLQPEASHAKEEWSVELATFALG